MEELPRYEFIKRKFVSIEIFLTISALVVTAVIIIFAGLTFSIFSAIHRNLNWQSIKAHVKDKYLKISEEAIYVLVLAMSVIITGILFACIVMD